MRGAPSFDKSNIYAGKGGLKSNINTPMLDHDLPPGNSMKIRKQPKWNLKRNWPLHLLVLPAFLLVLVFQYAPLPGLMMAFQDFKPWLGYFNSPWIGLDQFLKMIEFPQSRQVIVNTFIIS